MGDRFVGDATVREDKLRESDEEFLVSKGCGPCCCWCCGC
jgi:hypothetical protein